jgi:FlaA1/EpsC-like NDP-sugar epimerase
VKVVPPAEKWLDGNIDLNQIKNVRIEDLLERDPISLDSEHVKRELLGKTIFITGAAGSIGSEICRQVIQYQPRFIIAFDQAESALYDLEFELNRKGYQGKFKAIIGDVNKTSRVRYLFDKYRPEVVFHAAAYKHVPLMEGNPFEAIWVNVMGTKQIADFAVEFKCEKFVMVSTDKAVNPTNVMGATKRLAEMYTQGLNAQQPHCRFVTTRFGNVLGSNGSVIPVFKKQIENGGPITVTHEEITRYFMTIPEACELVLEAGAMGRGGEIYVFDMGESVKIIDLARKMIKLSGLRLGVDIEIQVTGLRPGEKLYEELLSNEENTIKTHHPKIMVAKVQDVHFDGIQGGINYITEIHKEATDLELVKALKTLVPEFISNNSIYEKLDSQGS